MGSVFVPPTPDQWQGPSKEAKDAFVPPSPDQWEGPSKGGDPKSVAGFIGNAVSSAGNLASQVGGAILHPIDTGVAAAKLGMGALEKGVRPIASEINRRAGWVGDPSTGSPDIPKTEEEQQVDRLIDQYKQRYGGVQNIADTLYTDPAGAAMDASMLLGGAGGALKAGAGLADAANASRVAGALRTGAGAVNKAAVATNPVVQGVRGVAAVAPKAASAVARIPSAVQEMITPFEPHAALTQAIKPRANQLHWGQAMETAVPDIKAAETAPIVDTQTALETIKRAKAQNRAAYDQFRGPAANMGTRVDLTPMADLMDASIPETLQHEASAGVPNAVAAVKSLKDTANAYRTSIPVEKAEKLLQEANSELDAYYAKYPRQQWSALQTNPETAATFAKAHALRDAIYNALDAPGQGAGAQELQRRYGALLEMEQEIQRRQNVAARQQPVSLAQQIGKAKAAGKLAMAGAKALTGHGLGAAVDAASAVGTNAVADWLKEQQMTNNLIKRAFAEYPHPARPFPQPTPVNVRGALGPGAIQMPGPTPPPSGIVPGSPAPTVHYNPNAPIGNGARALPPPTIKLPGMPDQSGIVPGSIPPAQPFRTGFPASAPKQLGAAPPASPTRGTPPPYKSNSARAMPAPGEPMPVQKIYTEQEIRHIASHAGKNPDAAVELAKRHGLLKPDHFTDVEPIQ